MKYLPDSAGDLGSGTETKNHYKTVHSCRSLLKSVIITADAKLLFIGNYYLCC